MLPAPFRSAARGVFLLLASALLFPAPAADLYFPDIIAHSPSRLHRLEARSPANVEGPYRKPFQRDFTYKLYRGSSRKPVWERRQENDESSPARVLLHDDGWVVVRAGEAQLLVLDPEGRRRLALDLVRAVPEVELERLAGSGWRRRWAESSLWYFLPLGGKLHFSIALWWGRRLTIDLAAGKLVELDEARRAELEAFEKRFILEALEAGARLTERFAGSEEEPPWTAEAGAVCTAAYLAGRRRLREAVPFLRRLEESPHAGRILDSGSVALAAGEVNPFSYGEYTLRRVAQVSLRRLGERPAGRHATCFRRHLEGGQGERFAGGPAEPGERRLGELRKGLTALQVLELAGPPDAVFLPLHAWEYDAGGAEAHTVRLVWDRRQVASVEHVRPPAWAEEEGEHDALLRELGGEASPIDLEPEPVAAAASAPSRTAWIVAAAGAALALAAAGLLVLGRRRK
jgi:hypothetical protein